MGEKGGVVHGMWMIITYRVFDVRRGVWDRREDSSAGNNDVDGIK